MLFRSGRINDRQLGEGFEKEVVPGWNVAHARFRALRIDPGAPAVEKVRVLTEFVGVRREMFAEYAAGLQTGDAARLRRAEELSMRSQVLMKEMLDRQGKS